MTAAEVLRMEQVDFVRDAKQILTAVDLSVRAGEHWALIGPNGAGKSTILSMCGAEKHPTRGSVWVLGQQLGRSRSGSCGSRSGTSTRGTRCALP